VICPTEQAKVRAADWHDGQFEHGGCAGVACRAGECASTAQLSQRRQRPDAFGTTRKSASNFQRGLMRPAQ
jgi:hypothetical protein